MKIGRVREIRLGELCTLALLTEANPERDQDLLRILISFRHAATLRAGSL